MEDEKLAKKVKKIRDMSQEQFAEQLEGLSEPISQNLEHGYWPSRMINKKKLLLAAATDLQLLYCAKHVLKKDRKKFGAKGTLARYMESIWRQRKEHADELGIVPAGKEWGLENFLAMEKELREQKGVKFEADNDAKGEIANKDLRDKVEAIRRLSPEQYINKIKMILHIVSGQVKQGLVEKAQLDEYELSIAAATDEQMYHYSKIAHERDKKSKFEQVFLRAFYERAEHADNLGVKTPSIISEAKEFFARKEGKEYKVETDGPKAENNPRMWEKGFEGDTAFRA